MEQDHALPNLRHLRALSYTARHRSVKRAAADIYLSQSAVTQAIIKLETECNEQFFERSSTGMICTPVGAVFVRRIDRAFDEIARAHAQIGRGPTGEDDPTRHISTAQIRAIIAIANHGSFRLAAEALGIAPPSIQRTARLLEHSLGYTLFLRTSRGIGLSEAGMQFARGAKLAVRELELAVEEIAQFRGNMTGRIAIGGLPMARATLLPSSVTRLLRAFPDLRVSILEGPYAALMEELRSGQIDVLVGALRDPAPFDDVVERGLLEDQLCVVVRRDHALTRQKCDRLTDTLGYPWIVPRAGTPTRRLYDAIFHSRALAAPKRVLEVSSHVSLSSLLEESDMIGLISRHQISREARAGTLCILPIDLPDTKRRIGVTTRRDWEPSKAQESFLQELSFVAAKLATCSPAWAADSAAMT